jgi:hypothetical protein
MTGRRYLDGRVVFMSFILGASLTVWLLFLATLEGGQLSAIVFVIPLAGLALGVLYNAFMIRCPHCNANLGHFTRSLIDFSLFRFPVRVRFCPHCSKDFQDEIKLKR